MTDHHDEIELVEAPYSCEEAPEDENLLQENFEIESEDEPEEQEEAETGSSRHWDEIEQKFARYERNYRARRIRELTLAPLKKKGKHSGAAARVAI